MSLLLPVLGLLTVGTALGVSAIVWVLRRLDHRCTLRTRPELCDRCVAVLRGEDRGGHLMCACGASSPHLYGAELLSWRAGHYGEPFPKLPGADDERGGKQPTTRVRAAAQEVERVQRVLAEELDETERRKIDRARRKPDPITPQLLREAENLGVRPPNSDSVSEAETESPLQ